MGDDSPRTLSSRGPEVGSQSAMRTPRPVARGFRLDSPGLSPESDHEAR